MKISIKQHTISVGSQYSIFIEKNEKYYAETAMFSWKIIHLYLKENLIERIKIYQSFYFFTPDYKIELPDGNRMKFKTMSIWRTHFQCILKNDIYELFLHQKRKTSIYKNGIQIGLCKKEAVSLLAGNNYELTLDFDADVELIISFMIILDHINSKNRGNLFTLDLGIVFKEYKKLDASWQPK